MFALKARSSEHERLLDHDIAISKGVGIIAGIQKLVRPVITYSFFGLFAYVEYTVASALFDSGIDPIKVMQHVWDPSTEAIFATIVSFWFGNRWADKRAGL